MVLPDGQPHLAGNDVTHDLRDAEGGSKAWSQVPMRADDTDRFDTNKNIAQKRRDAVQLDVHGCIGYEYVGTIWRAMRDEFVKVREVANVPVVATHAIRHRHPEYVRSIDARNQDRQQPGDVVHAGGTQAVAEPVCPDRFAGAERLRWRKQITKAVAGVHQEARFPVAEPDHGERAPCTDCRSDGLLDSGSRLPLRPRFASGSARDYGAKIMVHG